MLQQSRQPGGIQAEGFHHSDQTAVRSHLENSHAHRQETCQKRGRTSAEALSRLSHGEDIHGLDVVDPTGTTLQPLGEGHGLLPTRRHQGVVPRRHGDHAALLQTLVSAQQRLDEGDLGSRHRRGAQQVLPSDTGQPAEGAASGVRHPSAVYGVHTASVRQDGDDAQESSGAGRLATADEVPVH